MTVGPLAGVAAALFPHALLVELPDLAVDGRDVLYNTFHHRTHVTRLNGVQPITRLHTLTQHLTNINNDDLFKVCSRMGKRFSGGNYKGSYS